MIEPNQTRLDEFDDAKEHRKIVHRGCLYAEKRFKCNNVSNECEWIQMKS